MMADAATLRLNPRPHFVSGQQPTHLSLSPFFTLSEETQHVE